MSMYVDRLDTWPHRVDEAHPAEFFGEGKVSCHLTSDEEMEDFLAFAIRLGLDPRHIQDLSHNPLLIHFDITPAQREKALSLGAVEGHALSLLNVWGSKFR